MIITCENCHASYKLDDTLLDPAGSRVRCTNCGHVFIAQPPPAVSVPEEEAPAGGALGGIDELSERQRREFEKEFESDLNASAAPGQEKDLDLDLDLDDTGKTDDVGDAGGLNLDLDLDLDDDVQGFAADTEDLENLDLDLDLDPVTTRLPETASAQAPSDEGSDLDLEEIRKMLSVDDAAPMEAQPPVGSDTDALADLELDLGETPEVAATGHSEELALDLNREAEETGVPQEAADSDASDLDLDLDLDLEEAGAGTSEALDLDLDLDLDLSLEDAEGLSRPDAAGAEDLDLNLEPVASEPMQTETEVFEEQELDLGDIDMMLHADEEAVALGEGADQKEEGIVTSPDAPGGETAEIAADLVRTGRPEVELDVYGEETGVPRDPASDEEIATLGEAYTLRTSTDADGQTSLTAEPEPIVAREAMAAAGKRRGVWPLVILLLLGLVGGGVYWARQQGLDFAFLSRLMGQEAADEAGNLKISTLAIDSRFVDNATAGRLFVISGKARNDYDSPRSQIEIRGSLLAKGKRPVGSETVFGGNVLTDLDLSRLGIDEIKQRLGLKTGANDANVDVPPGGLVPFMVVFDNLPPDLEEFTLEVVSSR